MTKIFNLIYKVIYRYDIPLQTLSPRLERGDEKVVVILGGSGLHWQCPEQEYLFDEIQPLGLKLIPSIIKHYGVYIPDSCTHVYLTRHKPLGQVMAHNSSSLFCDVVNCLSGNILATRGPHCLLPLLKGIQTGSSFRWGE